MIRFSIALLSLVVIGKCGRSSAVDDNAFFGITTTDKPTYTYWEYGKCQHLCELPCKWTIVNMPDDKKLDMYMCSQLKVIKTSFIESLKGGDFKKAIIGVVVVTIAIMLAIAGGYYCCCNRKEEVKYQGRDEFRELGPRDERKALNKGAVIQV